MGEAKFLTLLFALAAVSHATISPSSTFKVGVVDQVVAHSFNAKTREDAVKVINTNLATMEKYAEMASREGVKMLTYPEYGITGFMDGPQVDRTNIIPFMEDLFRYPFPLPANATCSIDCSKAAPARREAQHGVACIAKKYQMYVTANLIQFEPCEVLKDHNCPYDNHYLYNTNIFYNPNGCLIQTYHKTHLVQEETRLDAPRKDEYTYFDTEFGRFGTITCADGMFKEPLVGLVQKYEIDHLIFPMAWPDSDELLLSVEWQHAIAARYGINVISPNMHYTKYLYRGSGIYQSQQVMNFTYNNEPQQSTLITADLPIPLSSKGASQNKQLVKHSAMSLKAKAVRLNSLTPPPDGNATIDNDVYSVRILKGLSGSASVCSNKLCCSLAYTRSSIDEFYILAAYKGPHGLVGTEMNVENCLVTKCAGNSLKSCAKRQSVSKTTFSGCKLTATFSTEYVYPSVLPSDFAFDKLKWSFNRPNFLNNELEISSDWPFVSAALIGLEF